MQSTKSKFRSLGKKDISSSHSPAVTANTILPADTSSDSQQIEAAPSSTALNRAKKYGLFLLSLPTTPSDDLIVEETCFLDVVAVHGITGDAYNTWTEGEKLWLRDFVPKDLPGARVFSFGYPAEVFCSLGTGNLDSYGRSLLEGLKGERRRKEDQGRAIIFICHSTGGIVVKKV